MTRKILIIFTIIVLGSCASKKPSIVTTKKAAAVHKTTANTTRKNSYSKPVAKNPSTTVTTEVIQSTSNTVVTSDLITNYVIQYKDIAMGNMQSYGIPASIILAQGILESGAGRGRLATSANNHFGIKCHKEWLGDSIKHDDDAAQECFRKYDQAADSYRDHALFLVGKKRYSSLFSLKKDDYKAWAKGLREAGYATDSKYPEKLISYIERYNLHQYDCMVTGNAYKPFENVKPVVRQTTSMPNDGSVYEVQQGETLYSISRKFNLQVEDLKKINNINTNTISIGQRLRVK